MRPVQCRYQLVDDPAALRIKYMANLARMSVKRCQSPEMRAPWSLPYLWIGPAELKVESASKVTEKEAKCMVRRRS